MVDEVKSAIKTTPRFPMEVFPKEMQEILRDTKDPYGFPYDGLALGMLTAASSAMGNSVVVIAQGDAVGVNLFSVQVAESGGGKTHDQKFAVAPLALMDENNREEYENEHRMYEEAWIRKKDANSKLSREDRKTQELLRLEFDKDWVASNGSLPKYVQMLLNNTTTEGLLKTLKDNSRGAIWSSQEINQILKNLNRYSGGKGGDEEMLLDFEHPGFVRITRSGEGSIANHTTIPMAFLSILGGIQGARSKDLFKEGRDVSGFAARFTFTWPEYGTIPEYSMEERLSSEIRRKHNSMWARVIRKLYNIHYQSATKTEPVERLELLFTKQAEDVVRKFMNENVVEVQNAGADGVIRSYVSKLSKKFFSMVAILHCLEHAFSGDSAYIPPKVESKTVEKACELTKYFTMMWIKVYKEYAFGKIAKLTDKRKDLYEKLPSSFTVKEAYTLSIAKGIMSRQATIKFIEGDKQEWYFRPIKGDDGEIIKYIKIEDEEI